MNELAKQLGIHYIFTHLHNSDRNMIGFEYDGKQYYGRIWAHYISNSVLYNMGIKQWTRYGI